MLGESLPTKGWAHLACIRWWLPGLYSRVSHLLFQCNLPVEAMPFSCLCSFGLETTSEYHGAHCSVGRRVQQVRVVGWVVGRVDG